MHIRTATLEYLDIIAQVEVEYFHGDVFWHQMGISF